MSREKSPTEDEINDIKDCDFELMSFMNNKLVVADDIMAPLLKGNKKYIHGGSFYLSGEHDDMDSLIDIESHDIVSPITVCKKRKKCQSIYKNLSLFFASNPPDKKKGSIYFVGDAHQSGEHIEVHWNCFVSDIGSKTLWWYDSSHDNDSSDDAGYNFSPVKKAEIHKTINEILGVKLSIVMVAGKHRAQQVCNDDNDAVDFFCQSWVLMFAAAVIDNKVSEYLNLDFYTYQNMILKTWLHCVFNRNKDLQNELKNKTRGAAISTCRLDVNDKIKLVKVGKIKDNKKDSCIAHVIKMYQK
ncbi:MAG: hypothetical protein PHG66_04470 [Candidatus Colwellbacteria bacterium]|nr:hypothetical protein [Candidatus Colwellbacteria bacterium]